MTTNESLPSNVTTNDGRRYDATTPTIIGVDASTTMMACCCLEGGKVRRTTDEGLPSRVTTLSDPARIFHSKRLQQQFVEFGMGADVVTLEGRPSSVVVVEAPLNEEILDAECSLIGQSQHYIEEANMLLNWNKELCQLLHELTSLPVYTLHFAIGRHLVQKKCGHQSRTLCRDDGKTAKQTHADRIKQHYAGLASIDCLDVIDAFTVAAGWQLLQNVTDLTSLRTELIIEDELRIAKLGKQSATSVWKKYPNKQFCSQQQ
jgi:hypothetical protein